MGHQVDVKVVTDERGVVWTVSARDPAKQYVNKLHSMGFDIVVLSRHTLMTGQLPDQPPECTDYIRDVRLKDCLLVLSGKHLEVID
jgi:hypothetical protein